ncbi:hypothetical protein CY35_02G007600 [Sphagnum magellanicum]|nr:hypothetical protein CY35_02G007600 [Sphagnum magellanicum]
MNFAKTVLSSISWKSGCYSGVHRLKAKIFCLLEVGLLQWSRQFEIMDSVAWNAFFNWVICDSIYLFVCTKKQTNCVPVFTRETF